MLQRCLSILVIAIVVCCPFICGSGNLHQHDETGPHLPLSPDDPCQPDACFCSVPSVLTSHTTYDGSLAVAAIPQPFSLLHDALLISASTIPAAAGHPPRCPVFESALPLLI